MGAFVDGLPGTCTSRWWRDNWRAADSMSCTGTLFRSSHFCRARQVAIHDACSHQMLGSAGPAIRRANRGRVLGSVSAAVGVFVVPNAGYILLVAAE